MKPKNDIHFLECFFFTYLNHYYTLFLNLFKCLSWPNECFCFRLFFNFVAKVDLCSYRKKRVVPDTKKVQEPELVF